MKGLRFLGNRKISIHDYPDFKPGKGEVLVKIARAAVCGTDVHKYRLPPEKIGRHSDGGPEIPGHEPSGWVAKLGPDTLGLPPGSRVLIAGVMSCGQCVWCLQGYNTACEAGPYGLAWNHHGADAEFLCVPAPNALPIPESLDFDSASVLTCAGGTAYTILRETGLRSEETLAILGLGPVGLCLLILAKSLGVRCLGVDLSPSRLKQALALGLDQGVDAGKEDPVKAVMDWTSSRGCSVVGECVGSDRTQEQALRMAAVRGRVAFAGLGAKPFSTSVDELLIGRQLRVQGIAATPIKYFPELIEIATRKKLPFGSLVTHRFPLEQAEEAFRIMESGQSGKVIFEVADEL